MKNWKISASLPIMLVIFLGTASVSYGATPHGVKYTVHNLGLTGPGPFQTNDSSRPEATQVCIFCHAPHNTSPSKRFLWNRSDSAATFGFYTTSVTLTATAKAVSTLGAESKMCMSCHDGVTALNAMANPTPTLSMDTSFDQIGDIWPDPWDPTLMGPDIGEGTGGSGGGNLTNDHPVSFSYTSAQSQDANLKAIANPKNQGLAFWGTNESVECTTCHDPHINYGMRTGLRQHLVGDPTYGGDISLAPFLRRTNSSSGLCFACHDK